MRILVIGSEGNIGTKLVAHLRRSGHEVLRSDIVQHHAPDYVQTDVVSLLDLYQRAQVFRANAVYHLAAMVSRVTCEAAPHLTIDTNLAGTNNVAQLCQVLGAKMINFSTSEVYGNIPGTLVESRTDLAPNNRYGLSKMLGEKLVEYEARMHGLDAVTIRPFMYYDEDETLGDHRSAMIRMAEAVLTRSQFSVHRNSRRGWLHMDDAVVALERLLSVESYQVINIGHPRVVETEQIGRLMCEREGVEFDSVLKLVDLPPQMTLEKQPDLTLQRTLLGFEPRIDLEQGVARVLAKVRSRLEFDVRRHDIY